MKRVFPYYELAASLRYGDKPWPEFPHVYLANMEISEASIRAFTGIYGQLFERFEARWPLAKTIRESLAAYDPERKPNALSQDMVAAAQDLLREAWRDSQPALEIIAARDKTQQGIIYGPKMNLQISIAATGVEILASDIWTFARLAFLCDHALGKTQICANPACKSPHGTPYFLQHKRGQMYCCHRCAVLVNVRRFRKGLETKPKSQTRSTPKRHKR